MSRVNVDAVAFTDPRFVRLAQILSLADADHARSKVEWLWLDCTSRGETSLPQWLVEQRLGPRGPEALIESELARWSRGRGDSKSRTLYIRGASERTAWLAKHKEQSSKGGKSRASSSSREAGRFTSQGTSQNTSPPAPAPDTSPALAPSLSPADQEKNSARPSGGGALPGFRDLVDQKAAERKARQPKPSEPTELERAAALRILAKLSERNGIAYSGTNEHIGLIARHLRSGVAEMDLRYVIAYCAAELEWAVKPDMAPYLRPETLFGPRTLSKYLDPARTWVSKLPPDDGYTQQGAA